MVDIVEKIQKNGVVHMDIKCSNILVTREGDSYKLMFIDFGCAVAITGVSLVVAIVSRV